MYQGRFIVTYVKHSTCGGYREVLALIKSAKHELFEHKAYSVEEYKKVIDILSKRQQRWFQSSNHMVDLNKKYGQGNPLDTKQLFCTLVKEGFVQLEVAQQFGKAL